MKTILSAKNINANERTFKDKDDFAEYFMICNYLLYQEDIGKRAILLLRYKNVYGSLFNYFNIGFDPVFHDEQTDDALQAVIVPTGPCSFIAMNIPEDENEQIIYRKFGENIPFNISALYGDMPVYIVNGIFDAISVYQSSSEDPSVNLFTKYNVYRLKNETAIALVGNDFSGLLAYIDKNNNRKPKYIVSISLDNDEEGCVAANSLLEELNKRNIPARICNISGKYKSPNECDIESSSLLQNNLHEQRAQIANNKYYEEEKKIYIFSLSSKGKLENFKRSATLGKFYSPISTGFPSLDCALGGGLYNNLTIIGAVSSLGKTAFILQIADYIAKNNHDVLFFALEMGDDELIARSISRESFLWCGNEYSPEGIALSTLDILHGVHCDNELRNTAYDSALLEYEKYSGHLYILTPDTDPSLRYESRHYINDESMIATLQNHIKIMNTTPVIMIDYLQLLGIDLDRNQKLSDKQIVDKNIVALKRISTKFHTPVIVVSSLNRASYNSKDIDFSAFKESGSIEYSCDTLIGLQFMDKSDPNEARQKEPRDIEAVILKQRNGSVGSKIKFHFHAKYNYFEEY